jgi:hypothetical protein
MNGRLQNKHTAHNMEMDSGAHKMAEMTYKKGSLLKHTVYNTGKVNFVTTVSALKGISEFICKAPPLTRNKIKIKFTVVLCRVRYICTSITRIWFTTSNML